MKLGIGCDHNAFYLKQELIPYLESQGHEIVDIGCYSSDEVDYPGVAKNLSTMILDEQVHKGILLCGTGIGMAMAANKVKGIRAAQTHDVYSARRACLSNNAHIITLGSQIVGPGLAKIIVDEFLSQEFVESASSRKIAQVMDIEEE